MLRLIADDAEGHLSLPPTPEGGVVLRAVDLGPLALDAFRADEAAPRWWDPMRRGLRLQQARLERADLADANLRLADLYQANLRRARLCRAVLSGVRFEEALLEEALLEAADLAGADLRKAILSGATLTAAMLEEADARGASLRFARLERAVLEEADFRDADLWGARLDGAVAIGADFRGATLHEASLAGADLAGADLREADLRDANLRGCQLPGADLREARLTGASLEGANLQGARLQAMDLTATNVTHVHLSGAWLERTRLDRRQLGETLGEEAAEDYDQAALGYMALERNFDLLGDADAASWAYRKKRRMQKCEALSEARTCLHAGEFQSAARHGFQYARDQLVEWLCDYGESVWRVLGAIAFVFVFFALLYGVTGSVVRVGEGSTVGIESLRDVVDLAIFSLISMTSAEGPAVGLAPRSAAVHVLTGLQVLVSIALTGLLGFVLGSRIRR